MSNYTSLGEWSDSEEDEIIRNIVEENDHTGRGEKRKTSLGEWSDSEEDEIIRNIVEENDHTGQGEKRKTLNVNLSDSEDEPSKKRKNQNVVSSDSEDNDPTPSDEFIPPATSEENEQTGQGKKRKAENQDVEQEYYRIQPVKDYHSKKFNMTAKNYRVQFNNALDNSKARIVPMIYLTIY